MPQDDTPPTTVLQPPVVEGDDPANSSEPARQHFRKPGGELASTLASFPDGVVEGIRQVVKEQGKEVSFIRMTPGEKSQLTEIVYTYRRHGRKTSENEINRIAVNFMLSDYRVNGGNSLLARVLDALFA